MPDMFIIKNAGFIVTARQVQLILLDRSAEFGESRFSQQWLSSANVQHKST